MEFLRKRMKSKTSINNRYKNGVILCPGETAQEGIDIIQSKEIKNLLADPKYEDKLNKLEQK